MPSLIFGRAIDDAALAQVFGGAEDDEAGVVAETFEDEQRKQQNLDEYVPPVVEHDYQAGASEGSTPVDMPETALPMTPADDFHAWRGEPSQSPREVFTEGLHITSAEDPIITGQRQTVRDPIRVEPGSSGWVYDVYGANHSDWFVAPEDVARARYIHPDGYVDGYVKNPNFVSGAHDADVKFRGGAALGIAAYEVGSYVLPYAAEQVDRLERSGYTVPANAIREVGHVANDLMTGFAPIATGVTAGLEAIGVPTRYAAWTGIAADAAFSLTPPGWIYDAIRVPGALGWAAVSAGARHSSRAAAISSFTGAP